MQRLPAVVLLTIQIFAFSFTPANSEENSPKTDDTAMQDKTGASMDRDYALQALSSVKSDLLPGKALYNGNPQTEEETSPSE